MFVNFQRPCGSLTWDRVQPFRQLGWVYHFYFDLIHGCSAKRIELNALD